MLCRMVLGLGGQEIMYESVSLIRDESVSLIREELYTSRFRMC